MVQELNKSPFDFQQLLYNDLSVAPTQSMPSFNPICDF